MASSAARTAQGRPGASPMDPREAIEALLEARDALEPRELRDRRDALLSSEPREGAFSGGSRWSTKSSSSLPPSKRASKAADGFLEKCPKASAAWTRTRVDGDASTRQQTSSKSVGTLRAAHSAAAAEPREPPKQHAKAHAAASGAQPSPSRQTRMSVAGQGAKPGPAGGPAGTKSGFGAPFFFLAAPSSGAAPQSATPGS
mmetsp:Transcript_32591/g.112202  ORF Transcript_32591/g.112202 Transcript_32591/m.112202 type:complete len:201 (-) Transcript_32591:406-1008(-)